MIAPQRSVGDRFEERDDVGSAVRRAASPASRSRTPTSSRSDGDSQWEITYFDTAPRRGAHSPAPLYDGCELALDPRRVRECGERSGLDPRARARGAPCVSPRRAPVPGLDAWRARSSGRSPGARPASGRSMGANESRHRYLPPQRAQAPPASRPRACSSARARGDPDPPRAPLRWRSPRWKSYAMPETIRPVGFVGRCSDRSPDFSAASSTSRGVVMRREEKPQLAPEHIHFLEVVRQDEPAPARGRGPSASGPTFGCRPVGRRPRCRREKGGAGLRSSRAARASRLLEIAVEARNFLDEGQPNTRARW